MFMAPVPVEEMHIATGVSPWTGNISRKKVRGYLMLVAFNLEQIGYPRYLQLKNFFSLRKTLEEDTSRDPANTRDGKTKERLTCCMNSSISSDFQVFL